MKTNNSRIIYTLIIATFLAFTAGFLRLFPASAQTKEMIYLACVRKTYQTIKTSYYKKVDDEVLIRGAVNRIRKQIPSAPEPGSYTWQGFEQYYYEQCRKNPGAGGRIAEAGLDGMVDSLKDPYSVLLTPEKRKKLEGGDGSGVGVELGYKNGHVVVIAPVLDSPAEKAGIRSGDILMAINGRSVAGMSLYEAAMQIDGKRGQKISFTFLRDGKKIVISPVFSTYQLDPIRYALLSDDIGYIKIGIFNGKILSEFTYVLNIMKSKKVKGLVLDLRNNPGGDLSEALSIAARFVPGGELVWIRREGKEPVPRNSGSGESFSAPVVVLVNEGSASASEVLSGALSDNGKAILMGHQTFGKGVIQTQYKMPGGALLNLTTESYLTPNKTDINGVGLKPKIYLKDCSQKTDPAKDPAVIAAWTVLTKKK